MSEQVVVITSIAEGASAIELCSLLEEKGLTCWSPIREEDPNAAVWSLPSKLRSARAMVLVTSEPDEHREAVETARQNGLPVIVAAPGGKRKWQSVLRELAAALGLSDEWSGPDSVSAQPKTDIADDEEEYIEFIAENVSEAQVFVRFGLFDRAIARLKTVFAKAPRNLEAHDELLKIYLEEEEWKNAAGTAADFLDCLRFRGDEESFGILRAHLESMGFSVDDGPPIEVGYGEEDPVPTKNVSSSPPHPAPPHHAPASEEPHAPRPLAPHKMPSAHEVPALELPALRNFKSSQPVFQSSGVESELSGIDFFIDHGMLDEARMRIQQLHLEHPDHPGIEERKARIEAMGLRSSSPGIVLELDDPWEAATKVGDDAPVDTLFLSEQQTEPEPFPAAGPVGEGDSLVCTAFVPESVEPGDMFVVKVCVHKPAQSSHPMLDSQYDRRESNMLARNVVRGEGVHFTLSLPGFEIDGDGQEVSWVGEPDGVEFGVVVPFGLASGTVTGMLSVRTSTGPAGDFAVTIPVT